MRPSLRLLSLCSVASQLGFALLPAVAGAQALPDADETEEAVAPADPAQLVEQATKAFGEHKFAVSARLFEAAYKLDTRRVAASPTHSAATASCFRPSRPARLRQRVRSASDGWRATLSRRATIPRP